MTNQMLKRLQASKTFVCVYKLLHFCANPQKLPAKNSHLKVSAWLGQGGGGEGTFHWCAVPACSHTLPEGYRGDAITRRN